MTNPPGMVAHYRLIELLGAGGMGEVWKAEDTLLGRLVAIKFLPPEASGDAARRELFLREARLASSLTDARIARVYQLGRHDGRDFIVMEFVPGRALDRVLAEEGPLSPERVVGLGCQIARALAGAHRRGLLHRDVKPANVMLTPEGEIKLVDFGVARLAADAARDGDAAADAGRPAGPGEEASLRIPGVTTRALGGTPRYMSPEQLLGRGQDARTDVYSLGVTLYELLSGRHPYTAAPPYELAQQILTGRVTPIHQAVPGIPARIGAVVTKAMAVEPDARPHDMAALAEELQAALDAPTPAAVALRRTRSTLRWVVFGVGLLALAAVGLLGIAGLRSRAELPIADSHAGEVRVFSHPAWARVTLDNADAGRATPCILRGLAPGDHVISVHRDGFIVADAPRHVTVHAGRSIAVIFKLERPSN